MEESLAEDSAAGADPVESLDTILAPMTREAFLADYFRQGLLHAPGASGRFAALMPWPALNRILASQRLAPPRLQLMRAGREIPAERYLRTRGPNRRIEAGATTALLSQGATMILSFVDEMMPGIAGLSDSIAEALGAQVNVNLYAGWRRDNGFALHWDSHDVIVLQISGRKHWRVHHPAYPDPIKSSRFVPPPEGDAPAWDGMLEDGALLYIPRGWAHIATPVDEPSLHLTIAIRSPNGGDFLRWLTGEVEAIAALRADLGHGSASVADGADALREGIASAIDAAAVKRFLQSFQAEQSARPVFNLPAFDTGPGAVLDDASAVQLAGQRRLEIASGPDPESRLVLADGREWPASPAVAKRLAGLSSVRSVTLEALKAELDDGEARELEATLRGFLRVGVISVSA